MKSVLLPVICDAGQEARFQCACDLVRAVDGRLTCLDLSPKPFADGDYTIEFPRGALAEDTLEVERQNCALLEARLVSSDIAHKWIDADGPAAQAVITHAVLNDIVVTGSHGPDGHPAPGDLAAQIVRKVRRPVLAVPGDARHIDLFGCVLVAWDGSGPCAVALRAAIPLLRLAAEVRVVAIGGAAAPAVAADYCRARGITATSHTAPGGRRTSAVLIEHAARFQAAYLVMGAYGHSPLTEALFGGATRDMLRHAATPLLLAA